MTLTEFILTYVLLLPVFFAIDIVWIAKVANGMYKKELAKIAKFNKDGGLSARIGPAVLFYLTYVAAIVFFVVREANDDLVLAAASGAFLGFVMYATYDLTNRATLEHFPLRVTIIDLIWGTTLTAILSVVGTLIYSGVIS